MLIKEATGATVTAVGAAGGRDRPGASPGVCARGRPGGRRRGGRDRRVRLADGGARVRGGVPPAGSRPRADRRPDADRRVRSDGALPRDARSAGRRQASSSGVTWPMEPRASCRSTPVDGSPCWASSCPPSSACSPRARRPRYVAMARLRQAMTEASPETLDVSVEAPAAGPKLDLARSADAADPGDDARRRRRGGGRARSSRCCANGELWRADGRRPRLRRIAGQRPAAGLRPTAGGRGGRDLVALVAGGERDR